MFSNSYWVQILTNSTTIFKIIVSFIAIPGMMSTGLLGSVAYLINVRVGMFKI